MNIGALLFLVAVTILHEYVHYGDNQDGIQQKGEEEIQLEKDAYEIEITKDNAIRIIQEWINKQNMNE